MPMNNNTKTTFLILILLQGLHSIEEYIGKLWDVFPPVKYFTSLFFRKPQNRIFNCLVFNKTFV